MKIIVAGTRTFNDPLFVAGIIKTALEKWNVTCTEIVSGGASGADRCGEAYALKLGIALKIFPAKWDEYGKSAGYRRNMEMAGYADALIAFWDGRSPGTKHMINLAIKRKMPRIICLINNTPYTFLNVKADGTLK